MPLVKTSKISGRGGWKTANYGYGQTRVLNKREQTAYERYCEYCQRVCNYPGARDFIWYVVNNSLPSV